MKPRATDGTLQTTQISLQLLELVVELEGATLDELADKTELAKSTVHNHATTLQEFGYFIKEDNSYYPGLKLYHFGDFARKRNDLYRIAKSVVAELARETNLEVDFTIEENGRIVSLYDQSNYADTPSYLVDRRLFHVHCTASGKAILAEYSNHRVREIIDQWGLPAVTDRTITDVDEFLDELDRVRQQGYATNTNEAIEGMWAISKVIEMPNGDVAGSLNVCGPTYLHSEDRQRSALESLSQKVETFERRILEQRESDSE